MLTLCTLFNSNYLDKGLTLYESLEKVSNDFILYVLAMDDKCFNILTQENRKHLIAIDLKDFENEDLLKAKSNRSFGEYCFTCTASLIKYILVTYNPEYCSYIDADMYFYSDPICIIEEMKERNASVQITGHRFNKFEAIKQRNLVGEFCVEFNTFKNNKEGHALLDLWVLQCLNSCSNSDGIHYGDQKYMNNWINDYYFVIETLNLGAGIAPWNLNQYKANGNNLTNGIIYKKTGETINIVFYHYESIMYIDERNINTNAYRYWGINDKLFYILYSNYLKHIHQTKKHLKFKYNLSIYLKSNPGHSTFDIPDKKLNILSKIVNLCKILFSINNIKKNYLKTIPSILLKNKNIICIDK